MEPYLNVKEAYPIYDTVVVCRSLYGKEQQVNGWYTSFAAFADDERHTFFKNRTAGSTHLAYCNLDSADTIDFVYHVCSLGVRFIAPVSPDAIDEPNTSPAHMGENNLAWWLFDLPMHVGIDFRVQQDTVLESNCISSPAGYGSRGGGGAQPAQDGSTNAPNQIAWKTVIGGHGEVCIDNRFLFPKPIGIPRNTSIEANLYVTDYARAVMLDWLGPNSNVLLTQEQAAAPADGDFYSVPTRYMIQVSLFGYREVQQRGNYHAPGAIQR
jgi:hypothetical protein